MGGAYGLVALVYHLDLMMNGTIPCEVLMAKFIHIAGSEHVLFDK